MKLTDKKPRFPRHLLSKTCDYFSISSCDYCTWYYVHITAFCVGIEKGRQPSFSKKHTKKLQTTYFIEQLFNKVQEKIPELML